MAKSFCPTQKGTKQLTPETSLLVNNFWSLDGSMDGHVGQNQKKIMPTSVKWMWTLIMISFFLSPPPPPPLLIISCFERHIQQSVPSAASFTFRFLGCGGWQCATIDSQNNRRGEGRKGGQFCCGQNKKQ